VTTDDALRLHLANMREMWGLADYGPLAKLLEPAAAALIGHVQPVAGARILDLAAGTGNVAALAAERGADSVACDLSPKMVRAGKSRMAAAEGSPVRWVEADMENLPLAAGTVDSALSSFGLIYAPRPAWALREVHRVLAPHGCLAFTAWTPAGFMGEAIRQLRECIPPTPWIADTLDWGRDDVVSSWLITAGFDVVSIHRRPLHWEFASLRSMTDFFVAHSPLHHAIDCFCGSDARDAFASIEKLAHQSGGSAQVNAEYILVSGRSAADGK
jgi:SAM-dependent methyltransferase